MRRPSPFSFTSIVAPRLLAHAESRRGKGKKKTPVDGISIHTDGLKSKFVSSCGEGRDLSMRWNWGREFFSFFFSHVAIVVGMGSG